MVLRQTFHPLLTLLFLLLPLAACTSGTTATEPPVEDSFGSEEQAAYRTAFEQIYGEPRMYVLMALTSPGIDGVEGLPAALVSLQTRLSDLEAETLASFQSRNEESTAITEDMDLGIPYVLLTRADFDAIFAPNTSGWDVFYTRYPNSPGMTTVSAVGFNTDLTQALVYIGTTSHWLAGAGYYLLLEKEDLTWRISEQVLAWIS
jgi:hypothetical protein